MSYPFARDVLQAAAEALRPPEDLSPSQWAAKNRYLMEGTTFRPGKWSNTVFPHGVGIMDSVEEALEKGKRGVVLMKSGQGSGSECMINVMGWLRVRIAGPFLYLISKDEIAKEFGRERFDWINKTCPPLKRICLRGRGSGEQILIKRYTKGKIVLAGGQSVRNLESTPYPVVFVDEYDSLQDELPGRGDPLRNALIRMDAFPSDTLAVAFAHPTVVERGAGRLYYEESDQRRGFVDCPHCGEEFWLQWDHVQVFPRDGQSVESARRDPSCYEYITPCCSVTMTDAERCRAIDAGVTQRSILSPEEAERRQWIGVHFSQLYYKNKTIRELASDFIPGLDNQAIMRVFVNKKLGDVYQVETASTSVDEWRALVVTPRSEDDPRAYYMRQVPPGVQFLTAGQDSRTIELHYAIWGWGYQRDSAGNPHLCGWLIDAGVVPREHSPTIEASDLTVFDQLIYRERFARTDGSTPLSVKACFHDAGWQPIAVKEYCYTQKGRATPIWGDPISAESAAPEVRWGAPLKIRVGGREFTDPAMKGARLNTYALKLEFFGMVPSRFEPLSGGVPQPRIVLPRDVRDDYLAQSASEYLTDDGKGKKLWKHRGPNHWSDCNIYAYAAALGIAPLLRGRTADEVAEAEAKTYEPDGEAVGGYDEDREDDEDWRIGR